MPRASTLLAAAAVLLAVPAAAHAAPQGYYGIVPQGDGSVIEADLDLMRDGGIDRIRVPLQWGVAEPEPGVFDWTAFDELVRGTTSRGIDPFPFIYGSAGWAAASDTHGCVPDPVTDCSAYAPASDATQAAFANFARAAVQRYGPGGAFWAEHPEIPPRPIRVWQIWNEQNSPKYYEPAVDVAGYGRLLTVTTAAIRSVDPDAEIVLGGMWGPDTLTDGPGKPPVLLVSKFLKRLYKIGGIRNAFDSIAVHPYSTNLKGVLPQVEVVRKIAKRNGDRSAAIWATELGWGSGGPKSNPFVYTPRGQARLLRKSFKLFEEERRSLRLRGVFWYTWRDSASGSTICEWCGHAGLRAEDGSPKPAWNSFIRFTGGK